MAAPVQRLLNVNTRLMEKEAAIRSARIMRRLASVAIVIGPAIIATVYVLTLITWRKFDMVFINAPLIPIGVALTVFAVSVLFRVNVLSGLSQPSISKLELELQLIKEERRLEAADLELGVFYRRTSYKSEITGDLNSLRRESLHYRRISNALQSLVIIGSIGSAALSSLSVNFSYFRWATVVLTFVVGIAAGFLGYFKFRERSFYLQQTADAIEHEFNIADLGIGMYANLEDEKILVRLVEEVERLKSEQRKREQNLDQPHEGQEARDH